MGDTGFGGWLGVIIIIVLLLGGGGGLFGNNNATAAGYATTAEVQNSINSAFAQQNAQNILLSSANNNYETARLIDNQSMAMMNQNNSNLLAAINGFNATNQAIANGFSSVNQNIANLGYKMEECCCSIKTMMLENRLQDTQIALQSANTVNAINAQSQYLLSQLGSFTPGV
jgi:hypothetical protein